MAEKDWRDIWTLKGEMKVIFLQDFFAHQHLGGAELHDDVVAQYFESRGILHSKINTYNLTPEMILEHADKTWFISNFVGLKNVW